MPKKPIDYSKTVIYTIKTGNSLYVGSTTNITQRKNSHTNSISNVNNSHYNYKLYKVIRENDDEWCMLPYTKYPCKDKIEQTIEEERIRQLLKADLNGQSCGTGINRSELGKYEYERQYIMKDKEKWTDYQKHYRTTNKAKLDEYQQQYRTENKAKLAEQQNRKVTCECGCSVTKHNLQQHMKSKKHQNWVQSQS